MMGMDEEEAIGRITKLLERGCTMLAAHHDCGAPLFRCKGEVVCPVCSFEKAEASSSSTTTRSGLVAPQEAVSEAGEASHLLGSAQGKGSRRDEGEEAKLAEGTEPKTIGMGPIIRSPPKLAPPCDAARREVGAGHAGEAEASKASEASLSKVAAGVSEEHLDWEDMQAEEVHLRDSLLRRLRTLTEEIEKEQDLDRLRKLLECIEGLVRVLRSMGW